VKTAGWAVVRDKSLAGEYDAAHMLSPMPLAMTLGAGSNPMPMVVPAIENLNGSAITLHIKHKDKRDPKTWKGMRFAIPFDYSMHNFLLRYYLAEHGVDPDQDVQLRVMPPPDMVANLRSEAIDGFIVAEPFNQRAVYDGIGYIHTLSGEIWNGHPCCAFATTRKFASQMPSSFAALFRALVVANVYCNQAQNRKTVAEAISAPNFLNQPPGVVEQVLTGRYADGLGQVRTAPDRITFEAFPYPAMAVWILTQMKRWGYLKGDLTYAEVAERVFLASDARRRLTELGMRPPADDGRRYVIMGKEFDPARADAYLSSFAIRRTT
ncbi:MAG: nitrate ABC transporter substrate-binding protein, partial [Azospira oryzae]